MPKEIAHLAMAQKAFGSLPKDALFYDPIQSHFNLFLYGSIVPDICFFYVIGPHASVVQKAGDIFHTSSPSSLYPVIEFLKRCPKNDPAALALAAGVCTHIIADTVFHPMIYYFAGLDNVHKGATARHRMLETAMDLHFCWSFPQETQISLPQAVSSLEISSDQVNDFLKKLFCKQNEPWAKYLPYALKAHHLACRLFLNYKLYRAIHILDRMDLGLPEKLKVLVYPFDGPVRFDFFDHPLDYRDPVSGELFCKDIKSLAEQAVENILLLLNIVEKLSGAWTEFERVISHENLPRIRPCPPLQEKKFKYWYGAENLRQIIYRSIRFPAQ